MALLGDLPPGHVPPFLRAQVARGRGLLALAADDRAAAHGHLVTAVEMMTALGYPYWLARARTDLGALLIDDGRVEEGRREVGEAIAVLRPLRAAPALERAESLLARLGVAAGSTPLERSQERLAVRDAQPAHRVVSMCGRVATARHGRRVVAVRDVAKCRAATPRRIQQRGEELSRPIRPPSRDPGDQRGPQRCRRAGAPVHLLLPVVDDRVPGEPRERGHVGNRAPVDRVRG